MLSGELAAPAVSLAEAQAYVRVETGEEGAIERDFAGEQAMLNAAEVASLGGGPFTISVRQIGALALSRPRTITFN